MNEMIEVAQKLHRFEVLPSAELVWKPLPFFARVIEVEHGSDRIDPQTIHVIALAPEQGVGSEKISHLVSAIVKDERAPILVGAPAGILVLFEMGWYTGNIYSAINSAHRTNDDRRAGILKSLKKDLYAGAAPLPSRRSALR